MIALYIRLSEADTDISEYKEESNSITNQRTLLNDFVLEHPEFADQEIEEFVDDGFFGMNFDRPAFKRMVEFIRERKVDTVIVKDFSRLGRDYIEVGDYIERFFPFMGVRFLAVADGYDSDFHAVGDDKDLEIIMKNIINSYYSLDLSEKITSSIRSRTQRGEYVYAARPFGYLIDPKNAGNIVIDPVASKYIRMIFDLAIEGKGCGQIAKILNDAEIPIPNDYNVSNGIKGKGGKLRKTKHTYWNSTKVLDVIKNDCYKGVFRSGRFRRIIVGSRKNRALNDDEIVIIENHHDKIVSDEEWDKAQEIVECSYDAIPNTKRFPLKGKISCGNCGHALLYNERKIIDSYFTCNSESEYKKELGCCKERIEEGFINGLVYSQMKKWFSVLHTVDDSVREEEKARIKSITENGKEISKLSQLMKKEQTKKVALYESYSDGDIDIADFTKKRDELAVTIAGYKEKIEELHKRDAELRKSRKKECMDFELLMQKVNIFENEPILTRTMTEIFLNRVIVYDRWHIEIIWNYEDIVEALTDRG